MANGRIDQSQPEMPPGVGDISGLRPAGSEVVGGCSIRASRLSSRVKLNGAAAGGKYH